jgi:hypothetical protein
MQTCHHNPLEDQINCKDITQQKLLELLLIRSLTVSLSSRKRRPVSPVFCRAWKIIWFFDSFIWKSSTTAFSLRWKPLSNAFHTHLEYGCRAPIVWFSTSSNRTLDSKVIKTVSCKQSESAWHITCASARANMLPKQFDSKSVEFKCLHTSNLIPSSSMHSICWTSVEIVRFTIQHAKNIRRGHGVPIWFSTKEDNAFTCGPARAHGFPTTSSSRIGRIRVPFIASRCCK